MGLTYKGGANYHHSIKDNLSKLNKNSLFKKNGNHFGEISKGSAAVTTIKCSYPCESAQQFFDIIGYGGVFMHDLKKGEIVQNRVMMKDGTIINFRIHSKSGSPAVDIDIKRSVDNCGIRSHKIHFIK